jgi:alpha-glucoside transport system permease protein
MEITVDSRIVTAAIVVFGVPAVLIGYIWLTEQSIARLPYRARGKVRPWLWLAPALVLLVFFLVYPAIQTFLLSFQNAFSTKWVGTANYEWFFGVGGGVGALGNNVLWIIFLTLSTLVFGLIVAVLADRVRYEAFVKSVLFMPMAISGVAAALIWKFMYAYQPQGAPQTGTLDQILSFGGILPVAWLQTSTFSLNTFALIFIMTWIWTGFATVIISAALKSINPELLEAARVDGANEWQVFRGVTLPLLWPTLTVVGTTMTITALKAFDIVYVLTNGAYGTQVVANQMYQELFIASNTGRASAIAVVLLVTIIPIMAYNIRNFQTQEAIR